jgi:ABC-type Fe3+/spermidine/putrescine transport system ATPase subunit
MHSDVWLMVVIKSGIYYRLTLLLGPLSSGKTTLLLALAGKLDKV